MAGGLGPLALQWALNETVTGAVTLSKEILEAATSDDVQVSALAAVESFGNTLAICQKTETRVEDGLKQARNSRFVEFLKCKIGYATGDSCYALLLSTGGIRFLALAAAFTTWGHFEAAQSTRQMLAETSRQGQVLPTVGQLQTLYKALEPKLARLGYADEIMQWHIQMVDHIRKSPHANDPALVDHLGVPLVTRLASANGYPDPQTMAKLVNAFRELYRLGEASKVEIRASTASIWIIGFTVWCTGKPPKVMLKNRAVLYDDQFEELEVHLWAFVDEPEVEIAISTRIGAPKEIWRSGLQEQFYEWGGMLSIENFGKRVLQDCNLDSGLGNRAVTQAVVHSTTKLLRSLPLLRKHSPSTASNSAATGTQPADGKQNQVMVRQPRTVKKLQASVTEVISKYLSLEVDKCLPRELAEGQELCNLSSLNYYTTHLQEKCPCPYCSSDPSSEDECDIDWFKYYVSVITSQIIAISLFGTLDPMKLYFAGNRLVWDSPTAARLIAKCGKLLFTDSARFQKGLFGGVLAQAIGGGARSEEDIRVPDIFHLALQLIGHDKVEMRHLDNGRWIASEQRGQVVYPHTLDSRYLNPQSLLILDGGPGALYHAGVRYKLVMGRDTTLGRLGPPQTKIHDGSVASLLNLIPNEKLEWIVSR